MAQGKNITGLTDLILKCMSEPDPMLSMHASCREFYSPGSL